MTYKAYKEEKQLFGKAILQSLSENYENELAGCEPIGVSEAQKAAMEKIVNDHGICERRKYKRRLAALLIAAALLLAGCTMYVYRDGIREFTEQIFDTSSTVTFDNGESNKIREIEEFYTLSYVPEGYVQTSEFITDITIRYIWKNKNNDNLIFSQGQIDAIFGFDSEHGEVVPVEGYENTVYHIIIGKYHYYLWNDGTYAMCLEVSTELDKEEIRNIFMGISKK